MTCRVSNRFSKLPNQFKQQYSLFRSRMGTQTSQLSWISTTISPIFTRSGAGGSSEQLRPELPGRGALYWCPTSKKELQEAETKILSMVKVPTKQFFVRVGDHEVNTLITYPLNKDKPNLVMVHGFGAGLGLWAGNYDSLSKYYNIFAFDLLGFGRSSRPHLEHVSAEETESWWIDSIEGWRVSLSEKLAGDPGLYDSESSAAPSTGVVRDTTSSSEEEVDNTNSDGAHALDSFHLMGHSLGGFLTGCYALKYPEHVKHLILVDPVGVQKQASNMQIDWKFRMVINAMWKLPLFGLVRAMGPWGPSAVEKSRGDLAAMYPFQDNTVGNYLYHLIAQESAGEQAFARLFLPMVYARNPLIERIASLRVPRLSFVYGRESWVSSDPAYELIPQLRSAQGRVVVLPDAGHHVYGQQRELFHSVMGTFAQD